MYKIHNEKHVGFIFAYKKIFTIIVYLSGYFCGDKTKNKQKYDISLCFTQFFNKIIFIFYYVLILTKNNFKYYLIFNFLYFSNYGIIFYLFFIKTKINNIIDYCLKI